MDADGVSSIVIGTAIDIHKRLGPGLLESAYERILYHELRKKGLKLERQKQVSFRYDEIEIGHGFCVDLVVNDCLIVELKAIEKLATVHHRQVLTYLKLTGLHLGLLINFGQSTLREGLMRVVNRYPTPIHK